MKIAMLVNNLEVSGGYQKLVIRLGQELQKKGHSVEVFSPKVNKKACYPDDIKSLSLTSLKETEANNTPVIIYENLVKKVNQKFDTLIVHDELSLIGVALWPEPLPKKIVWMLNNQLPTNLVKYGVETKSVYKQTVGNLKTKFRESKKAVNRVKLIRRGVGLVTNFVTYDEFNKSLVRKILNRPATVVYAGADLDAFKKYAAKRKFESKKQFTVLSVGVLFPHRRYEDLINAMPILKEKGLKIKAIIVGRQDLSPDYYKKLTELVKNNGAQKEVAFKNYVSDKEMVKLYTDSDAFVFINDGFTWGISVFEAIAAGLPTIITDNIGAADLVKNTKTGWVVSPQNPQQVAEAIQDIITDRTEAKAIASRASKQLTPFVSWSAYTKRLLKVINS